METHAIGRNTIYQRWISMKNNQVIPNDDILRYYFYFMQERMNMFWRKVDGTHHTKWSDDPILRTYKFTNVYRATDRVSQYLIKNVIYRDIDIFKPEDVLLRILVFKIFNKIETWEYLEHTLYQPLTIETFEPHVLSVLLSKRQQYAPIFNNAYMMTGSHKDYDYLPTKHEKWLTMVKKEFIDANLFHAIMDASSMEAVYDILRERSFLGGFLAYQYTIDFNYSPYLNFSENSFVKAGIGAIRGIKKCFFEYGSCYEDAIRYIYENIDSLRTRYGYSDFRSLPGHEPTLIDLQNCFCETDKYLRARMPELVVDNVRIKQKYKESSKPIEFFFPEKWNVKLDKLCTKPNTKELMLF